MLSNEVVLCQLIYIIASIILYIVEIYVMFFGSRRFRFNTASFNKIFFIYGVDNILTGILYYFFFRMSATPVFFNLFEHLVGSNTVLVFFWQLVFYGAMISYLLDLCLSFNRLTAILMPLRYKTLWEDKIKWIVILFIIISFVAFWPLSFMQVIFKYDTNLQAYQMSETATPPIPWPTSTSTLGICVTVTCIGCFLCNVYVGFKLHRRRNVMTDVKQKQERWYFLFIMSIFLTQFLSCSTQVTCFQ